MKKNNLNAGESTAGLENKPAVQSVTVMPQSEESVRMGAPIAKITNNINGNMKSSSEWTLRAFFALDTEGKGFLYKKEILSVLRDEGVMEHRGLQDFVSDLEKLEDDDTITLKQFTIMTKGLIFLRRVLERNLVIPMFESFVSNYKKAFLEIKEDPHNEY